MGDPRFGEARVLGRIIIRPYEDFAFVIAAIGTYSMDRGLDLIEQGGDLRSVINACCGQGLYDNLAGGLVDADVQFTPSTPLAPAVLTHLPFAFAIHFQAGGIHHQVDRRMTGLHRQSRFKSPCRQKVVSPANPPPSTPEWT